MIDRLVKIFIPCSVNAGLRCLKLSSRLLNAYSRPLGFPHSWPVQGSEHYFAYSVENYLERALKACYVPLNNIPDDIVGLTRKGLPDYVRKHNLPYGIAHELDFS